MQIKKSSRTIENVLSCRDYCLPGKHIELKAPRVLSTEYVVVQFFGLKFYFSLFHKPIIIGYHTPQKRKTKFKPRIKLKPQHMQKLVPLKRSLIFSLTQKQTEGQDFHTKERQKKMDLIVHT